MKHAKYMDEINLFIHKCAIIIQERAIPSLDFGAIQQFHPLKKKINLSPIYTLKEICIPFERIFVQKKNTSSIPLAILLLMDYGNSIHSHV
jgi:hypothetical protein